MHISKTRKINILENIVVRGFIAICMFMRIDTAVPKQNRVTNYTSYENSSPDTRKYILDRYLILLNLNTNNHLPTKMSNN